MSQSRADRVFRDAQLITGVRADGVMRHELISDLLGERGVQPSTDIDRRQLLVLALVVDFELATLSREVGIFGVGLSVHGLEFPGGHRHSPGHQARDPGN